MKLHNIKASTLVNEIEAAFYSESPTESLLFQTIKSYLEKQNTKTQKKSKINSTLNNNNFAQQSGKNEQLRKLEKIDFTFNKSTLFNPSNYQDHKYVQFNKEAIKFLITKDLEIDQYTIM